MAHAAVRVALRCSALPVTVSCCLRSLQRVFDVASWRPGVNYSYATCATSCLLVTTSVTRCSGLCAIVSAASASASGSATASARVCCAAVIYFQCWRCLRCCSRCRSRCAAANPKAAPVACLLSVVFLMGGHRLTITRFVKGGEGGRV